MVFRSCLRTCQCGKILALGNSSWATDAIVWEFHLCLKISHFYSVIYLKAHYYTVTSINYSVTTTNSAVLPYTILHHRTWKCCVQKRYNMTLKYKFWDEGQWEMKLGWCLVLGEVFSIVHVILFLTVSLEISVRPGEQKIITGWITA